MTGFFSKKRFTITIAGLFTILSMLPFSCTAWAASDTETIENTIPEDTSSENRLEPESDSKRTYHAALGLQTADKLHIARFAYYTKNPGGVYCPYGEENWNKLTRNYDTKTDSGIGINVKNTEKKHSKHTKNKNKKLSEHKQKITVSGEFTDAELKGNGIYTVSLEHADFQNETTLSLLQLTTDIPSDAEITISNVKLIINKRDIVSFEEAFLEDDEIYLTGGKVILLLSHWQYGLKGRLSRFGHPEDTPEGWKLLRGGKDENISVTFTVSGFDYDNEEAQPTPAGNSELRKIIGADSPDNPAKENERGISIVAVIGGCLVIISAFITTIVIRLRKRS